MIPDTNQIKKPPTTNWRFWLGIILSIACLIWLVVSTEWDTVWQTLRRTNYWLVLGAMAANTAAIFVRARRWRLMFKPETTPPFGRLTAAMLIGQALNLLLPARIGDLVRASLIEKYRTAYVIGTQMTQMALDLFMLGGVVITLLFQITLPPWWRGSGEALLFTVAGALIAIVLGVGLRAQWLRLLDWLDRLWQQRGGHSLGHRLLNIARDLLYSLAPLAQPTILARAVVWSVLLWVLYATVNILLLGAIGEQMSWQVSFFVLVVLQLGAAVPSSPGRIGVFHYLSVQALAIFGSAGSTAVSYAILLHLVSIVLPIVLAAILASQMRLSLNATRQEQQNVAPH